MPAPRLMSISANSSKIIIFMITSNVEFYFGIKPLGKDQPALVRAAIDSSFSGVSLLDEASITI